MKSHPDPDTLLLGSHKLTQVGMVLRKSASPTTKLKACLFIPGCSGLCSVKFWTLKLTFQISPIVKNTFSYIELEFLMFQFVSSAMCPSTAGLQEKAVTKNLLMLKPLRALSAHWWP